MSGRKIRYLNLGAVIGPIIFTIVVFSLAFMRPGYSHVSQLMSELGETGAPNAIVMNTLGTPLLGVSILMFALSLYACLEKTRSSQAASAVILIGGVCMVAGGIFPCDPGCIPVTPIGKMHELVSNIGFTGIILAPFLLFIHFGNSYSWKTLRLSSLYVGIITMILVPIFLMGVFESWNGAIQRILLGLLLIWMEGVSLKLLREPH